MLFSIIMAINAELESQLIGNMFKKASLQTRLLTAM